MSNGYSKLENRSELLQCHAAFKRAVLGFYQRHWAPLFLLELGQCWPSTLLGTAGQLQGQYVDASFTRHARTHAPWESVYEGEMGLIGGGRPGEGLATNCCSAGQWNALSSFHAFPEGIFPTSPLCMILLDLFVSDVSLSVQKEGSKEETTENTLEKMEEHGD